MDKLRDEYNNDRTKVIFIATSDNPLWLHHHLINKDDVHFPHQRIRLSKISQPSLKEISMMHAHNDLAVKGTMIERNLHILIYPLHL